MSFENPKNNKYEIKKENIIALEDLPKDFSPKLKSLSWPLEVQGVGRTLEDGKNFEIRYPKGDLFYSWAVIIHELGHLRQDELNEIKKEKDELQRNLKKERNAFSRGMERVKKYNPDILDYLETEFKNSKNENKIPDFDSFMDLYNDFKNIIKINETFGLIEDDDLKYEKLKETEVPEFFNRINKNKVGITIDTDKANSEIFKIVKRIMVE